MSAEREPSGWTWRLLVAAGILSLLPLGALVAERLLQVPRLLEFSDYLVFWASGPVVREQGVAALYDPANFSARQNALLAGVFDRPAIYRPWLYPPSFLVISVAFSSMPVRLGAWFVQLGGMGLLRMAFAERTALWIAVVASPAAINTLVAGQLSAWITAAIVGGVLLLEEHALVAGVLWGLVSVKPHYFVLLPIALLSARAWHALMACVATAAALGLVSILRFGWEPWAWWLAVNTGPAQILDQGLTYIAPLVGSVFASVRAMGGSSPVAWTVQAGAMLLATRAVASGFRRQTSPRRRLLVLSAATLLFAPYWLPYDLLLPTVAIAFALPVASSAAQPIGELAVWMAIWLLPSAMAVAHLLLGAPITVPVVAAMLWYAVGRRSQGAVVASEPVTAGTS